MTEVYKRDRKSAELSKLFGHIKEHYTDATLAHVTVWKEKLVDIWTKFGVLHDAVIERAGKTELDEQSAILDGASDTYYKIRLSLGELTIAIEMDQSAPDKSQVGATLQVRHGVLITRFKTACGRIEESIGEMPLGQLDLERKTIDKLHGDLQEVVIDRIAHGADQAVLLKDEGVIDKWYCTVIQLIVDARLALTGNQESNHSTSIQMPRFEIAPFDGRVEKWEAFRDSFEQGVHLRKNMPSVQKLQYLKSSLRGEPEELVQNFALTNDNYEPAWKLLNDRYNDTQKLVVSHLEVLTSFPMCKESADDLRRMSNKTASSLLALANLGRPIDQWNDWVCYHVSQKLNPETRRMWEQHQAGKVELPIWTDLDQFLQNRIRALSSFVVQPSPSHSTSHKPSNKVRAHHQTMTRRAPIPKFSLNSKSDPKHTCPCCSEHHLISFCTEFRRLHVADRRQLVADTGLCFVCFNADHYASSCPSNRACQLCNQRHNSILHKSEQPATTSEQTRNQVSVNLTVTRSQVLLATAVVNILDVRGELHPMRALLDQGSEASFVSEHAAQLLQLKRSSEKVDIVGLSGSAAGRSSQSVAMQIINRNGKGCKFDVRAFVIPRITSQAPKLSVWSQQTWPHLSDIELADPDYMMNQTIDLLLGSDVYGMLLLPGLRKFTDAPTAQNTSIGWILSGSVSNQRSDKFEIQTHHAVVDDQLTRFWELEEAVAVRRHTVDETVCETFFESTVKRDSTGRMHVKLPLKRNIAHLGESQRFAVQRQLQIERRFDANTKFADQYRAFMAQYLLLGHMREVKTAEVDMTRQVSMMPSAGGEYYIPHHAVMKDSSSTTKLRVVFDASRRTTSGVSLNELMHIGPRLQDDLIEIMMRWRQYRIGFCADIEKMYRQIMVDEPGSKLQRIVWRPSKDDRMKVYELNTVTYGTAAAPYLAIKSLQTLAKSEQNRFPIGAKVVLNNFYVDDVLCGSDDDEKCIDMQSQLNALLSSGGFTLRKWASNSAAVLTQIAPADREHHLPLDITSDASISALGVQWNPATDKISFKVHIPGEEKDITKRQFLSAASSLYDPLGWLAPSIIEVKILFQSLWKEKIDWDDQLPVELAKRWAEIRTSLYVLKDVQINRWIGTMASSTVELHGFCDASMKAYAAVVFIRVLEKNKPPRIYNMCAKTKVAPIKVVSLPRLELCGAVLLVKVVDSVLRAMQRSDITVHCWTDSTIVLAWLRGSPSDFNVFVANRTSEIQSRYPSAHWRHVVSEENPADCASRGISPHQLLRHPLWWCGPNWLTQSSDAWPIQQSVDDTDEELRCRVHITSTHAASWDLILKFSSWRKLVRVTAWCVRFANNSRPKQYIKIQGVLTSSELIAAREFWIRHTQSTAYPTEIRCLKRSETISKSSSLRSLNPILSADCIVRVGGRLENALGINPTARQPAIIPRLSELAHLLISDAHEQTLHGGPTLVLAYLRRTFWLIDGPNQVRRFVNRCTVCFRFTCKPNHQMMGALPSARVTPSRPFQHCAMDYSGAMMVRSAKGRGHHASKAYVAVFICLATKAVHIELVSDLTTDGFIAAYERFTARRGCCTDIYSDNGTNFVGAAAVIQCSEQKQFGAQVQSILATKGTTWHFSPPLSPHFNGLAESGIRSVKHHIRRVVGECTLTFEEMTTMLCKIEACLNSRPLCPLSSDPTDLDALTPGHFLIGEPLRTIPQRDLSKSRPSALKRWQLTHQLVQQIWKRWSLEYLHTLQQRRKWQTSVDNMCIGDMVIVIEDNVPPAKWNLGRISDVHPGDDGKVRVVSIRTKGSTFKRSIDAHRHPVKICFDAVCVKGGGMKKQKIYIDLMQVDNTTGPV